MKQTRLRLIRDRLEEGHWIYRRWKVSKLVYVLEGVQRLKELEVDEIRNELTPVSLKEYNDKHNVNYSALGPFKPLKLKQ